MRTDLKKRLQRIEDLHRALQPPEPCEFYFTPHETEQQAQEQYLSEYGRNPGVNDLICIEVWDASRRQI